MSTSTLIPSIGMTFVEASERVRELVEAYESVEGEAPEAEALRCDLRTEYRQIYREIMLAPPRTLVDILAILDRLFCPIQGITHGIGKLEVGAIQRIREVIAAKLGDQQPVNDVSNAWAASVELFTRAGPRKLEIPQKPNAVMVRAGAAAAGVTEDEFRAGYLAAIAAFQGEGEAA